MWLILLQLMGDREDEDESESLLAIGELIASAIVSWKFTPSISQMVLHYLIHSYSIHS